MLSNRNALKLFTWPCMTGTVSCILEKRWCESWRLVYQTSSYSTTPPRGRCDHNFYTKPMLPVTIQIIMCHWTMMMPMMPTVIMPLLLHLHHQSAFHQPSRSRLLTLNVIPYNLVQIRVRVYWFQTPKTPKSHPDLGPNSKEPLYRDPTEPLQPVAISDVKLFASLSSF
jgi:hypothetical protein